MTLGPSTLAPSISANASFTRAGRFRHLVGLCHRVHASVDAAGYGDWTARAGAVARDLAGPAKRRRPDRHDDASAGTVRAAAADAAADRLRAATAAYF